MPASVRAARPFPTWRTAALALATLGARALLVRATLAKLRGDLDALNSGDYRPILANYAPDAVLHFNDGPHRWSGEHRGKAAVERFLRDFVAAGIRGRITELVVGGPPWRMTLMMRYDDHAHDPSGREIYRNRTALVAHARWGRIVEQWDFYEDSGRIEALEASLRALGVAPAAAQPSPEPRAVA